MDVNRASATTLGDWLDMTRAADVMMSDVVTIRRSDPLARAATVLLEERISGAPVVDENGVCVGVLSARDLVGAETAIDDERRRAQASAFFESQLALPLAIYEERLREVGDSVAPAAAQPAERFMTTHVVSVQKDASLRSILECMTDQAVHRVVVLDDDARLVGIISTLDVLHAALDEEE